MRRVLAGKPSDHDPFACGFRGPLGLELVAATFNAAKHDWVEVGHVLEGLVDLGVGVLLLQEIKRKRRRRDIGRQLRRRGYKVRYAAPEFAVGLDRDEWEIHRWWRPLMSPTRYWTLNYALVVVARHRETGLVGKFVTVHPPAHVQAPRHPSYPRVSRVLREWKVMLDRIARRRFTRAVERAGGIDFVLVGGDENFDLTQGPAAPPWLTDGPLTVVDPPKPTRGNRKIDRFRIRGLTPA